MPDAFSAPEALRLLMVIPFAGDTNREPIPANWAALLAQVEYPLAIWICDGLFRAGILECTEQDYAVSPAARPLLSMLQEGFPDLAPQLDEMERQVRRIWECLDAIEPKANRAIAEMMLSGPQTTDALALRCGVTDRQIRRDLEVMEKLNAIKTSREWREIRYELTEPQLMRRLLSIKEHSDLETYKLLSSHAKPIAKHLDALGSRMEQLTKCLHCFSKPFQRRMAQRMLAGPQSLQALMDDCGFDELAPFGIDRNDAAKLNLESMSDCGIVERENTAFRLVEHPDTQRILDWILPLDLRAKRKGQSFDAFSVEPTVSQQTKLKTIRGMYYAAATVKGERNVDATVAKLQAIVCIDPTFMLAHSALARHQSNREKFDEALAHAHVDHDADPESFTLSITLMRCGRQKEADEAHHAARAAQSAARAA